MGVASASEEDQTFFLTAGKVSATRHVLGGTRVSHACLALAEQASCDRGGCSPAAAVESSAGAASPTLPPRRAPCTLQWACLSTCGCAGAPAAAATRRAATASTRAQPSGRRRRGAPPVGVAWTWRGPAPPASASPSRPAALPSRATRTAAAAQCTCTSWRRGCLRRARQRRSSCRACTSCRARHLALPPAPVGRLAYRAAPLPRASGHACLPAQPAQLQRRRCTTCRQASCLWGGAAVDRLCQASAQAGGLATLGLCARLRGARPARGMVTAAMLSDCSWPLNQLPRLVTRACRMPNVQRTWHSRQPSRRP